MRHGKSRIKPWYPVYIDKWLFGSMRHELIVKEGETLMDLRGVFSDLLALSKKDEGWIRANESTPYPITQLAGMFNVPVEWLEKCIEICTRKEIGKITKYANGIMYINSHEEYDLSDRHKRRLEEGNVDMSENSDATAEMVKKNGHYTDIDIDIDIKKRDIDIDKTDMKVSFAEDVLLTPSEYNKLVEAHGAEVTREAITAVSNYKGSSGKKYKSDYKAILNWGIDRAKEKLAKFTKPTKWTPPEERART